jgi:hypothetical protein
MKDEAQELSDSERRRLIEELKMPLDVPAMVFIAVVLLLTITCITTTSTVAGTERSTAKLHAWIRADIFAAGHEAGRALPILVDSPVEPHGA